MQVTVTTQAIKLKKVLIERGKILKIRTLGFK